MVSKRFNLYGYYKSNKVGIYQQSKFHFMKIFTLCSNNIPVTVMLYYHYDLLVSLLHALRRVVNLGGAKRKSCKGPPHLAEAMLFRTHVQTDSGLAVPRTVGNETVWVPAQDGRPFYLSNTGAECRGNPCLKQ